MKRITQIISTALILVGSSCSDFLDEPLQGVYSTATFYKTEEHAFLALTGVYNAVSFVSTNNNIWVFGDVASDDATKGGLAGDQSDIQFIDEFNYARNNASIEKVWKHYYEGISRANYLIYYVPGIPMDATKKARVVAEGKFLRAYLYFTLVNIFGEIPIKLNPPLNPDEVNKPKSPVADVYVQIEKDLNEAILSLPEVNASQDLGHATKGAALGLLAKTYLYQAKYTEALATIALVDGLGLYQLTDLYTDNFVRASQNNSESLFEIQHLATQTPKLGSHLNQYFGASKDNGYFFNVPLQNFIDEFEQATGGEPDPRLDYTVGRQGHNWINGEPFDPPPSTPPWSPTGYLQRKHCVPTAEGPAGDSKLNYVYLRYADVLLMKAEALNELNRSAEAIVPLNMVRLRARLSFVNDPAQPGFPSIPAGMLPDVPDGGTAAVRDAIRHERRVELGFEFHRYFDLMRYGKQAAEAALGSTGFDFEQHRYFLIPQSELDTNPLIDN